MGTQKSRLWEGVMEQRWWRPVTLLTHSSAWVHGQVHGWVHGQVHGQVHGRGSEVASLRPHLVLLKKEIILVAAKSILKPGA